MIGIQGSGPPGSALVTGASGMLGSRLVEILIGNGWTVAAYIQSGSDESDIAATGAAIHRGDITDAAALRNAAEGCGAIFHAAALVPGSGASEQEFHRVNVEGTRNVLNIAVEISAQRVVHVSTVNTIAGQPGVVVDESIGPPTDIHRGYDASKVAGERLALEYAAIGLDVVVLNPAVMFGPRSRNSGRIINLFLRGRMPILPAPSRPMSFAFVDDAAVACMLAMAHGERGQRYIVANPPVSLRDFVGTLAEVSGRRRPRISLPSGLIALGVDALRLASPVTHWTPPVTGKGIRRGGALYDGGKAFRELGLEYTPLSAALKSTVSWINEHRYRRHHIGHQP